MFRVGIPYIKHMIGAINMFSDLIGAVPSTVVSGVLMVLCALGVLKVAKHAIGGVLKLIIIAILVVVFLSLGGTSISALLA